MFIDVSDEHATSIFSVRVYEYAKREQCDTDIGRQAYGTLSPSDRSKNGASIWCPSHGRFEE
jgi:hypothetical protein